MNFKKLLALSTVAILGVSAAHAADAEKKEEVTVDHSKNPVTGTETTTKTAKHKKAAKHGASKMEETTTTQKAHTDGSTATTTETKTEATTPAAPAAK